MATSEAPPGVVAAGTEGLMTASDAMVAAGREMVQSAGAADRQVPPLPEDRHGLVMLVVQFDEARERYERRVGERFESAGATLALQAIDTMDADTRWSRSRSGGGTMTGYRLGERTSEGLERSATHIDNLCTEGAARSAARAERIKRGLRAARAVTAGWIGPNADALATSTTRVGDELTATEPTVGDAYRGLGEVVRDMRGLASAIRDREEEWARKGWHEQAGSTITEWIGNRVPLVDHALNVLIT